MERGEVTVITLNNAHCYYLYRGQKMGFQYELAKAFSEFLDVKLNIKTVDSREELFKALRAGHGAVVIGMPQCNERG